MAITIESPQVAAPADDGSRGVWVYTEQWRGNLKSVGYELLAKGRELAGIDGEPSEPQGGVEAEAKDFMRVLCPKCKCEVNIRL